MWMGETINPVDQSIVPIQGFLELYFGSLTVRHDYSKWG